MIPALVLCGIVPCVAITLSAMQGAAKKHYRKLTPYPTGIPNPEVFTELNITLV
jgi:hypothetical protein